MFKFPLHPFHVWRCWLGWIWNGMSSVPLAPPRAFPLTVARGAAHSGTMPRSAPVAIDWPVMIPESETRPPESLSVRGVSEWDAPPERPIR